MKKRQKRLFSGVLSAILAVTPTVSASAADAWTTEPIDMVKDYIVIVREGEGVQSVEELLRGLSCAQMSVGETKQEMEARNMYVLSMTPSEVLRLSSDERVVAVEEDVIVHTLENGGTAGESTPAYEWNLSAVHATPDELALYPTDESAVKVAVLDSGTCVVADLQVQEYVNLVAEESEILDYYADGTGHGTAVAGILAAKDDDEGIVGVAPEVSLYSVKVFDQVNEAPISRIIEGIYWAIDHDMDIVNMSFGTTVNSLALYMAVQDAYEEDILMVAAAGNNGAVEYPAAYNEVIAVGAVDYQGDRAPFSAVGNALELMAPGVCVLSDSFYGGVMAADGTSLAAPHVAGAAAVLWAKDRSKSSDFIRQLLNASANRSRSESAVSYGNGLLDVKHAFEIYDEFAAAYVPGVHEYAGIAENTEAYVEGENPGYVVGSWVADDHNSQLEGANGFTTQDIRVMQWIAKRVDSEYGASTEVANIHGGKCYGALAHQKMDNYVNDIFFLYEISIALKNLNNNNITVQESIVDSVVARRKSINGIVIKEEFVNQIKDILSYTQFAAQNGVTYANEKLTTSNVNALKILGVALHLAGDVYAHRTIVPSYAVQNTFYGNTSNAITSNSINKNHFATGTTVCSLDILAETTYYPHEASTYGKTFCKDDSWNCFEKAVENMIVEFKDINVMSLANCERKQYEDNVLFYKERYTVATNYTVKYLLNRYKSGYTTLTSEVFLPGANGNTYNLVLNNLKGNYQEAGLIWNSGWSKYTTEDVK